MLLTKEQIKALPSGVYVTRACDHCGNVILNSYYYTAHGKDFDTRKCEVLWEEANNVSQSKKKGTSMASKSKKDREDEDDDDDEDTKKKKRDKDDDDDDNEDEDDDDDDDDKKSKKMKNKKKDKKKSKDKSSKKEKKDKKGSGGYRAGSNSAIMYDRLSDGKRHSFKEIFKGIDSPLPTVRRLQRHAKKFKKFRLDVSTEEKTIRLKKL